MPLAATVRFARDLPQSVLRTHLDTLAGIRALLPAGECRVRRLAGRLRSPGGETALLVELETASILGSSGDASGEPVSRIELLALPGFEELAEDLLRRVRTLVEVADDTPAGLMKLAVAARGRRVGDYSSKLTLELEPGQSADSALRSILRTLLATLRANVAGVIADHDTEFLHDFRVAIRRTRSALAQLKGVLPETTVDGFRTEFRWLGSLTNPCRDLDVYLLEMDAFRGTVGDSAEALGPLERLLEVERQRALGDIRSGLRSRRFRRLLDGWQEFLESPPLGGEPPPNAARPVRGLASQKIWKAYRRMRRRGLDLGDSPSLEALHRLRIDGKKLRYLLEFFRGLYGHAEIEPLVEQLKLLQDILGGINDLRVQQQRLHELAHRQELAGEVETLLAMGRLAGALQQRQDRLRADLTGVFPLFAGAEGRSLYRQLFTGGE
jgi:CHAD domain-containing protein